MNRLQLIGDPGIRHLMLEAASKVAMLMWQGAEPEAVTISCDKWKIVFKVEAQEDDAPGPETPMEQDILCALAGDTLRGEEICERAGYSWGGRFRGRLARMVRVGLLEKTSAGYKRSTISPLVPTAPVTHLNHLDWNPPSPAA